MLQSSLTKLVYGNDLLYEHSLNVKQILILLNPLCY